MTRQASAIARICERARREGRTALLETEALEIVRALGIAVPEHVVVRDAQQARRRREYLGFPSQRVVVKAVSPELPHRNELGGVEVVPNSVDAVAAAVTEIQRRLEKVPLRGYSIHRYVEHDRELGGELLLGMRHTPDFGPVVILGPGGGLTEFLASHLAPGREVAILSPRTGEPERIRSILERKAITPLITGGVRGRRPRVEIERLVMLVRRLLSFAEQSRASGVLEFEINPLVFDESGPIALDALARLGQLEGDRHERPLEKLRFLLEPRSVGIVGVSDEMNPGRIILDNLVRQGFPRERIAVIKPGRETLAGCACYADLGALPRPVDTLVLGIDASQIPGVVQQVVDTRKAESLIIIPGGLGERAGTGELVERIRDSLARSRASDWKGPVVNGGNCLGIRSVPARFDTLFIPEHKLPRPEAQAAPLALVSQSGAFAVAQLSRLVELNPRYVVSVGNQVDVTVGDYLAYLEDDPQIEVFAFYVEGFRPLDGLRWLEAASRARDRGKTVILYRAGRTAAGASASASHTSAIAGDYRVTRELARGAGVVVTESLEDFQETTRTFLALRDRPARGWRLGAMSNAGFECVAVADNLGRFELAGLAASTRERLRRLLERCRLERIVAVRNPFDATPIMADAEFEEAARAMVEDDNVDVALIGCVPLTGSLDTLGAGSGHAENVERCGAVASRLCRLWNEQSKPVGVVVDGGPLYDAMARKLRRHGVPTFRSVDRALHMLETFAAASLSD